MHDRRCLAAAVTIGGLLTLTGRPLIGLQATATISIWGLMFSPDLDLADTGRHQGGGCKAWHRWKRMGLGWCWKPYGFLIKHRSPYSHTLIPGTLIRLLYVFIPFVVGYLFIAKPDLWIIFDKLVSLDKEYLKSLEPLSSNIFLLLLWCFTADSIHLYSDNIPLKDWLA